MYLWSIKHHGDHKQGLYEISIFNTFQSLVSLRFNNFYEIKVRQMKITKLRGVINKFANICSRSFVPLYFRMILANINYNILWLRIEKHNNRR